jgi:hypothetical protein
LKEQKQRKPADETEAAKLKAAKGLLLTAAWFFLL